MKKQNILINPVIFLLLAITVLYSQSADSLNGYRAGFYQGQAFNSTANARGKVAFELYDLDHKNGRVRAFFGVSDGLEGEAWLTGKITDSGELDLTGDLLGYRMEIRAHAVSNGSIRADYTLEGANAQKGSFDVSFVSAIPANMADDSAFRSAPLSDLIGTWEVGGALPSQVNPVTGMSSGISFVDAHRLQFFPDGSFKHLWSHRHCDGTRCCSEQAMLENGNYALDDDTLSLNITGGTLINTDMCNTKINGRTPVKHRTETFKVSTQGTQLCLKQGSQAAACYQRQ